METVRETLRALNQSSQKVFENIRKAKGPKDSETASLLRLFNAVKVDSSKKKAIDKATLNRTIRNGYILHASIKPTEIMLAAIDDVIGISGKKANAAFHKSWAVVRDSSMEELVLQQIIHYFTTYGLESLGVYSQDMVYIPNEVLKLPSIKSGVPLIVIRGMRQQDILENIIKLASGIALSQEVLDDIMVLVKHYRWDSKFIDKVKNRELKALLYDYYEIVPSEPVEFLRHLVSKLTDESLLIKNDCLIEKIEQSSSKFLDELIKRAPDNLASIFFRFKPIFLAMKSISNNKTFFNRLRKKANKLHKPLPTDYLNNVTAQIKHNKLDLKRLKQKVTDATIFRKIRLAYALKYRLGNPNSIVYHIRNGRGWASDFGWDEKSNVQKAFDIVMDSVIADIKKNVKGKTFYIPRNVHYALPATEKQFTGNIPTGSYVSVPNDLIAGIHWTNTQDRVDLDLSVVNSSMKIGWDHSYRTDSRDVLFSGDVTDAPKPNGASELFYFKKAQQHSLVLMANYFNFSKGDSVPCKLLVASEKLKSLNKNYMVDVNKLLATANLTISKKQNILGLITNVDGQNRVYFANVSVGNSITSSYNENTQKVLNYLITKVTGSIDLNDVLMKAGAKVIDRKPKSGKFIDLSPEALSKTTFLDLLQT